MSCYAQELGGCEGGISREHYVSASALEEISPIHIVSGAAWQKPGEQTKLPTNALVVNVLCRKHNADLSPLDETGRLFTTALRGAFLRTDSEDQTSAEAEVDGGLLERWLLKIMSGALAGGIIRRGDQRFQWNATATWLRLLFGIAPFDRERGLYVLPTPFNPKETEGIGLQPCWHGESVCTGGIIHVLGVQLAIFTEYGAEPGLRELSTGMTTPALRRPRNLGFERAAGDRVIRFRWPGLHSANGLRFGQNVAAIR